MTQHITDTTIHRIVVISLCAALLLIIAGSILLLFYSKEIPDLMKILGATIVGALAGILTPQRNQ